MAESGKARRRWAIHLGAHKTATTHLQQSLGRAHEALRAQGVFYLPHEDTRRLLKFPGIKRPLRVRLTKRAGVKRPKLTPAERKRYSKACAASLIESLEQMAGTAARIVLSEEDLLGHTRDIFNGDYFRGHPRLGLIEALHGRDVPLDLFLAIRSLDTFLPSAYAQALRAIPADKLNFEERSAEMAQDPPSWAHLVENLHARMPQAQITVWDYADYAQNAGALQKLITGCALEVQSPQARPESTRSPGAEGIALAEAVPDQNWKTRHRRVDEIYAAHPATGPDTAYRPLSETACAAFRAAFADDLARLEQMPFVHFARF